MTPHRAADTVFVAQTAGSGLGTGTVLGITAILAALAVIAIDRYLDIDIIAIVTSNVTNVLAMIPIVGSIFRQDTSESGSGGGLFVFIRTRSGMLLIASLVLSFTVASDVIQVQPRVSIPLVTMLALVSLYLFLVFTDTFRLPVFIGVVTATVVLALSALGEPVIGAFAQSPVFPLIAVGTLVIAWRAVSAYRDRVSKIGRPQPVRYIRQRRGGGN